MKRIIGILVIIAFLFVSIDAEAQRRTRRAKKSNDRNKKEEVSVPFNQKLWYSINMGNLNFFNGNFSLSSRASVGYKLTDRLSTGISSKLFYDASQDRNGFNGGDDINLFSYGAGAFARFKVSQTIFLHAAYDVTSYEGAFIAGNTFFEERETFNYPLFGGGYISGFGPWTFGIDVFYIPSQGVRDITGNFVEWWFSANYNF